MYLIFFHDVNFRWPEESERPLLQPFRQTNDHSLSDYYVLYIDTLVNPCI